MVVFNSHAGCIKPYKGNLTLNVRIHIINNLMKNHIVKDK